MKEIIATKGLEVICTDDNKKCIISQINSDSYYLEIHPDTEDTTGSGYTGRSATIPDIKGVNGEIIYHPNYVGSKPVDKETFIKVEPESDVHNQMKAVFEKMTEAHKEALALCEELGGKGYCKKHRALAGGIESIRFKEDVKPTREWKKLSGNRGLYAPAKKDSDIAKRINELPVVEEEEMNNTYGFPCMQFVGTFVYQYPSIDTGINKEYLLHVEKGCIIAIKGGMTVIPKSEYYRLKGE